MMAGRAVTTIAVSRETQIRMRKIAGMLASKTGEQPTLDDALSYVLDIAERVILAENRNNTVNESNDARNTSVEGNQGE